MIELWDGYVITADEYQYILGKPAARMRGNQEGERMISATYHGTLAKALQAFHQLQLRNTIKENQMALSEAVPASAAIEKRIRALIKEPAFDSYLAEREN